MKQTIHIFLEGDRQNRQKQKKVFFQLLESPIFSTNPNNIKFQMLQEGKQLEEKIQSI